MPQRLFAPKCSKFRGFLAAGGEGRLGIHPKQLKWIRNILVTLVGFASNSFSLTVKGTGASADTEFPQHAILVSPQLCM